MFEKKNCRNLMTCVGEKCERLQIFIIIYARRIVLANTTQLKQHSKIKNCRSNIEQHMSLSRAYISISNLVNTPKSASLAIAEHLRMK